MLFIAKYPHDGNIKEGMSQRILAIDNHFENISRTYLFISYKFFLKKKKIYINDNVLQYNLSLFVHFPYIIKLLMKCKTIYIHSMLNGIYVTPFLKFLNNKKIIIDVHGIVPEEEALKQKMIRARLYNIAEREIFKYVKIVLTVTDKMTEFYRSKYKDQNLIKYITYPIIPRNILSTSKKDIFDFNEQYVLDEDKTIVLYSGNTQEWQNIEIMVGIIKKNLHENIYYVILTGEVEKMREMFLKQGVDSQVNENIIIKSVLPNQLEEEYRRANYGFILRDDIDVNKVACPTKMTEYLFYGIIPIVKSYHIGDFASHSYDCVPYESYNAMRLKKAKSKKNMLIVREMIKKTEAVDLKEILL